MNVAVSLLVLVLATLATAESDALSATLPEPLSDPEGPLPFTGVINLLGELVVDSSAYKRRADLQKKIEAENEIENDLVYDGWNAFLGDRGTRQLNQQSAENIFAQLVRTISEEEEEKDEEEEEEEEVVEMHAQ
jgi:hypothetical protein